MMDVPQKELSRVKGIKFNPRMRPLGEYIRPQTYAIGRQRVLRRNQLPGVELKPSNLNRMVVPHELSHGRQFLPDIGYGMKNRLGLNSELNIASLVQKINADLFRSVGGDRAKYVPLSLIERHANRVAKRVLQSPTGWKNFDKIYTEELSKVAEEGLKFYPSADAFRLLHNASRGDFGKYLLGHK